MIYLVRPTKYCMSRIVIVGSGSVVTVYWIVVCVGAYIDKVGLLDNMMTTNPRGKCDIRDCRCCGGIRQVRKTENEYHE